MGFNRDTRGSDDESEYAQTISAKFRTKHNRILLSPNNFLENLLPALDAMDSPSGDGVNSYVVSKEVSHTGIKVALSGVGGDELFAGYPFFKQYLKLMRLRRLWRPMVPVRNLIAKSLSRKGGKLNRYAELLEAPNADIFSFYPAFRKIISSRMMADCTVFGGQSLLLNDNLKNVTEQVGHLPLLSQVSVAEYLGYTQHTLLRDMDQMSMASSLEVREPFFDHELIEFVLHIPDKLKYPTYPKKLLVDSLDGLLPREIVHRKKQGFVFPWKEWMKNELRDFCEKQLISISQRDFIKGSHLMQYWKRFLSGDESVRWMEIWLFVVLEYWLQKNNVS